MLCRGERRIDNDKILFSADFVCKFVWEANKRRPAWSVDGFMIDWILFGEWDWVFFKKVVVFEIAVKHEWIFGRFETKRRFGSFKWNRYEVGKDWWNSWDEKPNWTTGTKCL
jgi:hypothetical protein